MRRRKSARPPVLLQQLRSDVNVDEVVDDLIAPASVALANDDLAPDCVIRIYYAGTTRSHSRKKLKEITQRILKAFAEES